MKNHNHEIGAVNPLLIASIVLGLLAAGLAGGFIWAYTNYLDQRDNTQSKVDTAVAQAQKEQSEKDEASFLEREKAPYRQLVGPEDLGKVSFDYPKTWSVYIAQSDIRGYKAYLNPATVPAVTNAQPFAVRVEITAQSYDNSVKVYEGLVKSGSLKSSPITVNGFNGVRLDGKFSNVRTGSTVLFKVRDKTLSLSTDVDSVRSDFDNIVLKSLNFIP